MTVAIVVSRADSVSEHVGEHLLALADWDTRTDADRSAAAGGGTYYATDGFEYRTFDDRHLDLPDAAAAFDDPDLLVFASRHAGDTGELLTAHFTGNFGPAEYGGTDGDLAEPCPNALSAVLDALADHAPEGYDVGMECTHHGPSRVGVPSMFVELGSGPDQWDDADAARAVARAILDLRGVAPHRERTVVGVGGNHYAPRFTRIARETDWAVGHVAADWCLDDLGDPDAPAARETLRQAVEGSRASHAVVDGEHPAVESVLADLGCDVVGETWVREVGDRPLDLVAAVEDALGPVEQGTRFGTVVPTTPDAIRVVDLPEELLADAQRVDADAARDAVFDHAVAAGTRDGGSRVEGRAVLATDGGEGDDTTTVSTEDAYDALVDALVTVLEPAYDAVERRDDAVVVHETSFDPERARTLGVPEGPAFGRLSNGESVTVDGREIDPEVVRRERVTEYPV